MEDSNQQSLVHYHLRATYDRIISETMRRLREQQGGLPAATLNELEERWRAQLESVLDVPELEIVATKARSMKRTVDFMPSQISSSDPKMLKTEPLVPSALIQPGLRDIDEVRRKLGSDIPKRPPLFASFGFHRSKPQPVNATEMLAISHDTVPSSSSSALVPVDAPESESEDEEFNGMFDDGEVEGGYLAEIADVKDNETPALSAIDDVPDADPGSVLGSDLDSDAWSEPEIEDHVYASKIEIKHRKNGQWKVELTNGVCSVNKEETIFKKATCLLNFNTD